MTAPTLVFLHGLAGSGRYWRRVVAGLPDERPRRCCVDLLGFGRSPWPDIAYTVDDHLAALEDWRASAGLAAAPLVLVGHSLGALLALEWATRLTESGAAVIGSVLVSLPVYRDPIAAQRRLARLSLLHRLTFTVPPLARATCTAMCQFRPLWRAFAPLIVRQFPPDVARDGVLHTWRSLSGTLNHCILGLTSDHLHRRAAGLPLTFVHGSADETAPLATVRELAAGLPNVRLLEVPEGTHDVPLTHPRWVVEALAPFLAAQDST